MFDIKSEFPESFWIPPRNKLDAYLNTINIGTKLASNSSCNIICLVRDCAKVLPYTIARLTNLSKLFRTSHIGFYENDSVDGTKRLLIQWKIKNPSNTSIFIKDFNLNRGNQDFSLSRRARMAFCRNQYMKNEMFSEYDYTIIYDGDITGGFSYHGILNSFGYDCWDVVGSNSIHYRENNEEKQRLYYDSWALRRFEDKDAGPEYTSKHCEIINRLRWERGEEPFEVLSCFGGLSIYKSKFLIGQKYFDYDIDHKTLCDGIRSIGGKVFLNPSQIVLYNSTFYTPDLIEDL